jgi:hypothetical protein
MTRNRLKKKKIMPNQELRSHKTPLTTTTPSRARIPIINRRLNEVLASSARISTAIFFLPILL